MHLSSVSLGKIVQIREKLKQMASTGHKVRHFESGDPKFAMSLDLVSHFNGILEDGHCHYVPNTGIKELKDAIILKLSHAGIKASPEHIFVTNGAMHALFVTFQVLAQLVDKKTALFPCPMWAEAVDNAKLAGFSVRELAVFKHGTVGLSKADEYQVDESVYFINYPNNPTGYIGNDVQTVATVDKLKSQDKWIVTDEAYEDLVYSREDFPAVSKVLGEYSKGVHIFSCSKSYAMPGMRVGYIYCPNPEFGALAETVLRCSINGVSLPSQRIAAKALTLPSEDVAITSRKFILKNLMECLHTSLLGTKSCVSARPYGGLFLWVVIHQDVLDHFFGVEGLCDFFVENGYGVIPGSAFGSLPFVNRCVRLSFASVSASDIMDLILFIKTHLDKYVRGKHAQVEFNFEEMG